MANWESAPVVETAAPKWEQAPQVASTAQQRYDSALAKVRGLDSFKNWDDARFKRMSEALLQPSNSFELMQNSTLFNFGDEIAATAHAGNDQIAKWLGHGGEDFGPSWEAWQELQSARQELGREKAGGVGTAAEIAGAVTSLGANAAPRAAQAGSVALDMLKGGAAAGAGGFASGAGATDGDLVERLKGGAATALLTSPIGAASVPVARGVEALVGAFAPKAAAKAAPKAADTLADAKAAYTAADTADVAIRPQATNLLRQDLDAFLSKKGVYLPSGKISGFPKIRKAMKHLDAYSAADMTIPQFQRFEEALQEAAGSTKAGEGALGREMLAMLDGYIDSLPPTAYRGPGSGTDAAANWAKGKQLYAQGKRSKTIEKLIYDARFSGTDDFAGSLRAGFASFLRNDKKRRGFKPDEIAAIEQFVSGGPIGGLMRSLSRNGGLPGAAWGTMAGGPIGAVAVPLAGAGARSGLDRGARGQAEFIRAMVAGAPVAQRGSLQGIEGMAGVGSVPALDQPRGLLEDLLFSR